MRVLHLAPHPDDELLGAPATLLSLRDAGHDIVNYACSLGSDGPQREKRRSELEEACRRAKFRLIIPEPPPPGTPMAQRDLAGEISALLQAERFDVVVAPSPHDRHPRHELVGRVARDAVEAAGRPSRLWLWAVWGELHFPTTLVPYEQPRLEEILHALSAHRSQVGRNDYADLVVGRGRAYRVLGPELVSGYGAAGISAPYAELTSEVVWDGHRWLLGKRRTLDPAAPIVAPDGSEVGWWLHQQSVTDVLKGRQGG